MNSGTGNNGSDKDAILITGASGRVATSFLPWLQPGRKLRLTDLYPAEKGDYKIFGMDLLQREEVIEKTTGLRSIVHCAIASYQTDLVRESAAWNDYHRRMLDVNIKSTFHILEAARLNKIRQIVFISSLTIAAGNGIDSSWSESLPPKPVDVYACTKLFGEQLGELYSREYGINFISLRLGQPYPLGFQQEKVWEADPLASTLLTTHRDIARAIDCALDARDIKHGIFNVLSRNGLQKLNRAKNLEIGFEPMDYWEADRNRSSSHGDLTKETAIS